MVQPRPGLDVSALVHGVLADVEYSGPSLLSHRLRSMIDVDDLAIGGQTDPYSRLFNTRAGRQVAQEVGNESKSLDLVSTWSIEILFEYLAAAPDYHVIDGALTQRFLSVPGIANDPPTLLILDPAVADVSDSQRLTNEIDFDPGKLAAAFQRLRAFGRDRVGLQLLSLPVEATPESTAELLWVSQPEVVLSRRPEMIPLCAPTPYLALDSRGRSSSVGILCTDAEGALGVTGCYHGTGPVGTPVQVGGVASTVKLADAVQDIVFIQLPDGYIPPAVYALAGVRQNRAPSEAEPVCFEGAGSKARIPTRVKSHDAGILRRRPTIQLKVQTPADTNFGDSGAALVDSDDQVVGFGFERTAPGDFPEITDWVWAANAIDALGLTPV